MAPTYRKLRGGVLLLAAALTASAGAQDAAGRRPKVLASPRGGNEQPIKLDAASSEVDYKTNTVEFKDVTISQGDTRVQAQHAHATGLNFANSKWTFEGDVHIDAEEHGNLRSDAAVVEFQDNRILRATVTGKPANFEQKRIGSEQMAHGHADKIVYDINEGTVRLNEDAWLSDGQSEISGPLLIYNIRAQKVQASAPGNDQRVHIVIQPRTSAPAGKEGKTPDAAKPQPQSPPQS
ncbi:MAG TPA: lipopolysaccharide transport periplasmic protein LptA [Steroidobacteraceae bacterium]|nr:lipopolysaccharide transport periplasmic protein LptA [Steroidobacteraceae bacterium]